MRRSFLLVCLVLAGCTPDATPPSASTATIPDGIPVTVESVLDGDSLRVAIDGESVEVRLLGINAPERDECWADAARAALGEELSLGTISLVGFDEDQYGRLLAYVYSDVTNVNRSLIIGGSALAIASDHAELPDFLAAEEEAVSLERGLWSAAACGSDEAGSAVRIWAVEPDAPGRDDRNPNGEFVAITNEGADVDLTGWAMRDESSAHRYRFPDDFVLTSRAIVTIRSGCGDDSDTDLYWCADGTVWTNSGDTVLLLDSFGAVVDRHRYFGD